MPLHSPLYAMIARISDGVYIMQVSINPDRYIYNDVPSPTYYSSFNHARNHIIKLIPKIKMSRILFVKYRKDLPESYDSKKKREIALARAKQSSKYAKTLAGDWNVAGVI